MKPPHPERSGHRVRTRPTVVLTRIGIASSLGLAAASPLAVATERDLGAHEHGAATLDIALDGARLYVDLEGPADNVLGFEHAPSTDEQRATVAEAERLLGSAELFVPSAAAGCALEEAMVDIALPESGHEDGDHDHGHDGHDDADGDAHDEEHDEEHDEKHDHGHDDDDADGDAHEEGHSDAHEEGHGEDHEEAHSGEHDEHEDGETHSEMTAGYVFACDDPAALDELATTLFERFDGFVDVDVQLVGPGGQDGARLTADDATVSLESIR